MLLTRVPHFRDLMVASFECPHCNTRYAATQYNMRYAVLCTNGAHACDAKGKSYVVRALQIV